MLVPTGGRITNQGESQTSIIILPGSSAGAKHPASSPCDIDGEVFTLHPASSSDLRRWVLRGPSLAGWNTLAGEFDIDAQWSKFTLQLARLKKNGCFPAALTALQIRSSIAQRIPLPANQVPSFFYSERGMASIDLAPGMEVRLQQILAPAKSNSPSRSAFRMLLASYDVVSRRGEGVRLKLAQKNQGGINIRPASEAKDFFALSQRFAAAQSLRLLLKGFSANHRASDAILIGASNDSDLDSVSSLILGKDPAACVDYHDTVCISFPRDALSLFSTIRINGRRASFPFGSPFGAVLRSIPPTQQAQALQSARVYRRLSRGHYAEIEFPRTSSGASELLLLPGDRIQWEP
ncbi:MAG TPA: hypothetical protein VGR47_09470 [Terracidiphilus sp.]|nr:hypothetical protein [Terracidiphilus sp.]